MQKQTKDVADETIIPSEKGGSDPALQQEDVAVKAEEQKQQANSSEPSDNKARPTESDKPSGSGNPLEDIETAVLLVVNSHGNVLPVVQIENLNMKRIASPREVYRICLDAADQLSSVSLLGEMTGIYSTIAKEQGKLMAQSIAQLLIQMQQSKSKGETKS